MRPKVKHKENEERKSSDENIKEEQFVEMEPAQDVEDGFALSIFNAYVYHFPLLD